MLFLQPLSSLVYMFLTWVAADVHLVMPDLAELAQADSAKGMGQAFQGPQAAREARTLR